MPTGCGVGYIILPREYGRDSGMKPVSRIRVLEPLSLSGVCMHSVYGNFVWSCHTIHRIHTSCHRVAAVGLEIRTVVFFVLFLSCLSVVLSPVGPAARCSQ